MCPQKTRPAEISQPGLQERLGISADAAQLLRWLERLHAEEMVGRLTPVVEEDCEKRIGIRCPWDSKHFPTYIQVLVDEINEKTDYDLRTQAWYKYADVQTRIRIARKKTDLEETTKLSMFRINSRIGLRSRGLSIRFPERPTWEILVTFFVLRFPNALGPLARLVAFFTDFLMPAIGFPCEE